jgi:hypothetical protein
MDPEPLSPYFGDYPDGMYWSAVRPEGTEPDDEVDEDYTVEGPHLRIMWDEGAGPVLGLGRTSSGTTPSGCGEHWT